MYLRLAVGMPPFCADYDYLPTGHGWMSGPVLFGGLLVAVVIGAAFGLLRRSRWSLPVFGLTWAAVFMLPVSNLVPTMQYMAERFLYLPLLGGLMAVAALGVPVEDRAHGHGLEHSRPFVLGQHRLAAILDLAG